MGEMGGTCNRKERGLTKSPPNGRGSRRTEEWVDERQLINVQSRAIMWTSTLEGVGGALVCLGGLEGVGDALIVLGGLEGVGGALVGLGGIEGVGDAI